MTTKWTKDQPAILGADGPIENDAEILIYEEHCDGLSQKARLGFSNDYVIDEIFIKKIMTIVKSLEAVYEGHLDNYIHVQARFNLSYINM